MASSSSHSFSNIARPYALAAFEYARDEKQLPAWKVFLDSAASVVNHHAVAKLLTDPLIPSAKLLDLFDAILGTGLTPEQKNFLQLIVQNQRLIVLPDIAHLYQTYYAALLKTSKVRLITAIEIKDDFRQDLEKTLAKRIQREITLQCEVDPTIIGGAIIHIVDSDKVIDGSIRGKLNRLLEFSLR